MAKKCKSFDRLFPVFSIRSTGRVLRLEIGALADVVQAPVLSPFFFLLRESMKCCLIPARATRDCFLLPSVPFPLEEGDTSPVFFFFKTFLSFRCDLHSLRGGEIIRMLGRPLVSVALVLPPPPPRTDG